MRALLLCVIVVLCFTTATVADDQEQQDEPDRQQEELRRNLQAMDMLASHTQIAADNFRIEQSSWEKPVAELQPEHEHLVQQDQHQQHRDLQLLQLEQQEQQLHEVDRQTAQFQRQSLTLNDTVFTEPFLLPIHQSLQFPHCFTPGIECTLAFWIWIAPQEELLDESPDHSLVSIISSSLPPGLLSPSLLLGVAPDKLKPFLSLNGLTNGALVGVFSHTAIDPGRWVHLALSLDEHALSLFVNGRRTAVVTIPAPTPPTSSSSMIERGRSPPSNANISTIGDDPSSDQTSNPFGWTDLGCEQCRLWPFNMTLGFGGSRVTPGADAVIARAVLYNSKMDDSGSHAAISDMKAMKRSRKQGRGPLVFNFPLIQYDSDDLDDESLEDLPMAISNEITEAGGEAMFVSGNLMNNFLNATGGSSFSSPALPLLGVAFQHLLPEELRNVTLPPSLPADIISSLPIHPPLPPGTGFITVSANTQAEFLPTRRRSSAHIDFRRAAAYYGTLAERSAGSLLDADGVHVQFLEFEDIAADPEGSSVHGESSDEIIYHRSQAEAGNADSQAWLGTQLYWGAMGLERNQVEAVRWLEAAAAQDHPDGLYNMAVMHAYGHGGAPQNNDLARQYFERAAALDFAPAKNGLAMLLSNTGSEKDLQEAFKLFNESSALGNSDGYYNKGILLRQGLGVAKDPYAARVALQAAADLGHPSACVMLAEMLVIGEGGPDDYIGALLLLKLISEMGKTGRALNDGIKSFVDNNVTEAIRLLTPLASVGYEVAQLNLAYIYKEQLGRSDLAIPALRLAAGQGSPKALVTLGNFAYWGTGIDANATYALQLFAAAGRSDSAHGAFNCGMIGRYLLGDGVASDHNEARLWFQKARKLDEDAELPCYLALNVVLPLMMYPWASDFVRSIAKASLSSALPSPTFFLLAFYQNCRNMLFVVMAQHQGGSLLWSIMSTNLHAAFSYVPLGGPDFQRIIFIFVISLALPWIVMFLFVNRGVPRNWHQHQQGRHLEPQEQHDSVAARMQQDMENLEQHAGPQLERENDE